MKKRHYVGLAALLALFSAGAYWQVKQPIESASPTIEAAVSDAPSVSPTDTPVPILDQRSGDSAIYPDVPGVVNPDITQANIGSNICAGPGKWSTKSIRPTTAVTDPIKLKALARWNQEHGTNYQKGDGELDHLISLELGGAPADPDNLWFEKWDYTASNGQDLGAHTKDKVENCLHAMVCAGTITLDTAQKAISHDWYRVYSEYPQCQ